MSSCLRVALLFVSVSPCFAHFAFADRVPKDDNPSHEYFWPSGRGRVGNYSASLFAAPKDLQSSLAWTWTADGKSKKVPTLSYGRYSNVPNGVNIDDKSNIFLTSLDGVRKFSPEGEILWTYLRRDEHEELPDQSSLYKGVVYTSTTAGRVVAISMHDGKELWSTKLASTDGNNGWVSAHEGVVITGSDARDDIRGRKGCCGAADQSVTGLNATNGKIMWNFKPEVPVWNFMASFADDGTFTFQDLEGRAYRNRVHDGSNIWKAGGVENTWTDGTSLLGPNGIVYAVNTRHHGAEKADSPGDVSAYRLSDGKRLWTKTVPRPPNNMPAIGRLAGRSGLSLIQPVGQQVMQGAPTDIYALDAETGETQWVFNGPSQKGMLQAGDSNPIAQFQRKQAGVRSITLPNPWGAPSIDADGTVFIGSEEGPIYALKDSNGDGKVHGDHEVSSFNTGACFSGSSSPAIAPGLVAIASIDALYVFKSGHHQNH